MTDALRNVAKVTYYLGLLSIVLALLIRFIPPIAGAIPMTTRGLLIFAGTLFLCTLASHALARAEG